MPSLLSVILTGTHCLTIIWCDDRQFWPIIHSYRFLIFLFFLNIFQLTRNFIFSSDKILIAKTRLLFTRQCRVKTANLHDAASSFLALYFFLRSRLLTPSPTYLHLIISSSSQPQKDIVFISFKLLPSQAQFSFFLLPNLYPALSHRVSSLYVQHVQHQYKIQQQQQRYFLFSDRARPSADKNVAKSV